MTWESSPYIWLLGWIGDAQQLFLFEPFQVDLIQNSDVDLPLLIFLLC